MRGEAARFYFEFLESVWKGQWKTLAVVRIDVDCAVQHVADSGQKPARNGNNGLSGVCSVRRCSRLCSRTSQRDEFGNIPAIQRQLQDPLVFYNLANPCIPGFHHRRIGLHFNLFRYLSDFEDGIDRGAAVHLQNNSALQKRAESRQTCFQTVRPEWKIRQSIRTGFVRDCCSRCTSLRLCGSYFNAGQYRPALVLDRATDLRRCLCPDCDGSFK